MAEDNQLLWTRTTKNLLSCEWTERTHAFFRKPGLSVKNKEFLHPDYIIQENNKKRKSRSGSKLTKKIFWSY